ncbi:MAG: GDSL family lipase [Chloroflexota bacterium]
MPSPVFQPGQKLVFIGDSITDAGRRTEAHAPYGRGYVFFIYSFLHARYPALALTVINQGISGNTIRDLKARWERDVIAEQPDWLTVKIGINDVWRRVTGRLDEAVPLDEYVATYRELLEETRQRTSARFILMEPYVIEPDRADPFRSLMDRYVEAVDALAGECGAILVRTQAAFDDALEKQPTAFWAPDRVHPGGPGHAVIARAFLRAVGYGDV